MGVYIKGMEMPKDGDKVYMITFSDGKVCASDKPFEWHEVVHVPPHGALIDRDDLFATCPELVDGYKRITDDLVVILEEEGET